MSEAVYVVQRSTVLQIPDVGGPGSEVEAWVDLAMVTVPARTHRKTVVEKALKLADAVPTEGAIVVRVLGEESARETTVETEQPPPRLKLS